MQHTIFQRASLLCLWLIALVHPACTSVDGDSGGSDGDTEGSADGSNEGQTEGAGDGSIEGTPDGQALPNVIFECELSDVFGAATSDGPVFNQAYFGRDPDSDIHCESGVAHSMDARAPGFDLSPFSYVDAMYLIDDTVEFFQRQGLILEGDRFRGIICTDTPPVVIGVQLNTLRVRSNAFCVAWQADE